jgi:5'-nucleotidase (lipoprotein e(P4) family)
MRKTKLLLALASSCALSSHAFAATPREIQYAQSVEHDALCAQTYRDAWLVLSGKIAAFRTPWAVVLDADETVLDNSEFVADLRRRDAQMSPREWDQWVARKAAKALPGAREFLDHVRAAGGKVVYITDRLTAQEAPTRENLDALGLFKDGDGLLVKKDAKDTKDVRRDCVEKGLERCKALGPRKIIATFGDSLRDHVEVYGDAAKRLRGEAEGEPSWGATRFVLPNPLYGQWETGYQGNY